MPVSRNSTRNSAQRAIRQEALREQLQNRVKIQHVIDLLSKLENEKQEIEPEMLERYKIVINTKMKLIGKYLADLKATEVTGSGGGDLIMNHKLDDAALERIIASE